MRAGAPGTVLTPLSVEAGKALTAYLMLVFLLILALGAAATLFALDMLDRGKL